jgi:hypothetical protein
MKDDADTEYLLLMPGTRQEIIDGLNTPANEYLPESDIAW